MTLDSESDVRQLLGEKLKEYREHAGIRAVDLAEGAQVGRQYVYLVEGGKANFTIDSYVEMLRYCGVSFQELLTALQHSDIPNAQQRYHRSLSEILNSGQQDLIDGIDVALHAFTETVRTRKLRAAPKDKKRKKAG